MEVDVQVEGGSEALNGADRSGVCAVAGSEVRSQSNFSTPSADLPAARASGGGWRATFGKTRVWEYGAR